MEQEFSEFRASNKPLKHKLKDAVPDAGSTIMTNSANFAKNYSQYILFIDTLTMLDTTKFIP